MKIKALGAVGTVTGSCFQLELDNGDIALLDCGLFQGGRQTELRNSNTANYNPKKIKAIVITHAHMDHSGLVPRLVKEGYQGPVYATSPTCDLLKVLWQDAAFIQKHEATWKTRKNARQGKGGVEPLYDENDAARAATMLKPVDFGQETEILPGLVLHYVVAGHILGAGSVHFTVREGRERRGIVFSGDLGRPGQLIVPDSETPPRADTIFMETTYGNRLHKDLNASIDELIGVVNQACQEGGKILIPAFAVERTQEIVFLLSKAWQENQIPRDLPVILDSPLAIATTEIYERYKQLFDVETKELAKYGISPTSMPTLRVTRNAQESQKLNELNQPAIIIAGSGMANAGRILHHLKHNLWRRNCHVVFVGFQAQGTTGRRLVEGAKVVNIFREAIDVEARIHTIGGFSGHADRDELLKWLEPQVHDQLQVNLIHGEASSTLSFSELARQTFPNVKFNIPQWLRYVDLAAAEQARPVEEPRPAVVEDPAVSRSFVNRLDRLKAKAGAASSLTPAQLAQLEDYLARAEDVLLAQER